MIFTDKAITYLKSIKPLDECAIKVSVVGGGCSGLSYKMEWITAENAIEKEKRLDIDGVAIHVDPKSWLFLSDLTVDYSDGLEGKGFEYINPKASRSCGCGSSFSA